MTKPWIFFLTFMIVTPTGASRSSFGKPPEANQQTRSTSPPSGPGFSAFVSVKPDPGVQNELLPLCYQLANKLTDANVAAPEARFGHYRKGLEGSNYEVQGWAGFITATRRIPGGHRVTLRVSAILSMAYDSYYTFEYFDVIGSNVTFIGFAPPPPRTPRFILGL